MKASQTVYLTDDRKKAVAEGDAKARFLLVRSGGEIDEKQYADIDGAAALIEGKKKAKEEEPKGKGKH